MKEWYHNDAFGKRSGTWVRRGVLIFLFLSFLLSIPRPGRAAFLDQSGLKVDSIIKDLEISLIRHDFHPGATTRTYYFKGHATYEESDPDNDGKIISSGPVTIEDVVTWNSKTHRLTCRGKESYGGHTITSEVIYECEYMDPLLAKTPPNCKVISSNFGGVNYLPVIWGDNRSAIQIYRDSIPSSWRFSMILEALAKSMHLEISSTEIKSPPGNALLMMKYATDVPVPKNWAAWFYVEREDAMGAYGGEIKDFYGHKIESPATRRLRGNGVIFFPLKALPPGNYAVYTRMLTSLTTHYDSQKLFFKVVEGYGYAYSDPKASRIVVPREGQLTGTFPIFRILCYKRPNPSLNSSMVLQIQYRKAGSEGPYKLLREETIPGKDWVYSEGARVYGKWVKLLDFDADYRARVAPDDQAYDKHTPRWGPWRHFKVRLGRDLKILEPAEKQTYTDKVPVRIQLASDLSEKATLTLIWLWLSSPNQFPGDSTILFKHQVPITPGTRYFRETVEASKLFDLRAQKNMAVTPEGTFVLQVYTTPESRGLSDTRSFQAAQLGTAWTDEGQKKSLTTHITLPSPATFPLKVRGNQKFKIIEPKKEMQTYGQGPPDDIPIRIQLPSSLTKKTTLVMRYYWMESTIDPFGTKLFEYDATISPGQRMYQGGIGKGFLLNLKNKKVGGGNPYYGFFRMWVTTKPDNPEIKDYRDFNIVGEDDLGVKIPHAMNLRPLTILPFKAKYRSLEGIAIRIRHTGKEKPQFQVRFRPTAGKSYKLLRHVPHRFTTLGDETALHVKFRDPGNYQIRFRPGRNGRWSAWRSFEIVGTGLTNAKKISPLTARQLAVRLTPPEIESPKERQAFMLAGREVRITAKIRHVAGTKVILEVQHGAHGRFKTICPKVSKRKGKTESAFTMHLARTGDYRIRAKLAAVPNAVWSKWRVFRVDKLNKKLLHNVRPQNPARGMHLNPSGITIK